MKKFLLSALALGAATLSQASQAKNLNLACVYERDQDANQDPLGMVFTVSVIEENSPVEVYLSSENDRTARLKKYAVVERKIYGQGEPELRFYTLSARQFDLVLLDNSGTNFRFVNRKTKKPLVCSINRVVYANPALTRNN